MHRHTFTHSCTHARTRAHKNEHTHTHMGLTTGNRRETRPVCLPINKGKRNKGERIWRDEQLGGIRDRLCFIIICFLFIYSSMCLFMFMCWFIYFLIYESDCVFLYRSIYLFICLISCGFRSVKGNRAFVKVLWFERNLGFFSLFFLCHLTSSFGFVSMWCFTS